ncbi:hypothetical protein [Streptacidiphilus rugosus]|uniref:hypothetical protein n=1 Tax=Streptacidiphilus rugosus TaxID=405783 RepID=UPI00056B5D70|nr:hypothetical protein [Streptacidiphilus rugosus]
MRDTDGQARLSNDAHYLQSTARLFGWHIAWEPDGCARMSRGDQTLRAFFTPGGAFWHARATGPGTTDHDLALTDTVQALERHGDDPTMPPAA